MTLAHQISPDKYPDHDVVLIGGNPALIDPYEWAYWGDPDLSTAEKVAHMRRLSEVPINHNKLRLETSSTSLRHALTAPFKGRLLATIELFDVPRRFTEADLMTLFDPKFLQFPKGDPRKVHRKGLRDGPLPSLDALLRKTEPPRPNPHEEFLNVLIGLSAQEQKQFLMRDISFMPIVRARREFVRLLEGKGPTLSGAKRPCIGEIDDPLLRGTYAEVGGNYVVPCAAALTATNWFAHDIGRAIQKQRGWQKRKIVIRGFWEVDGMRLKEEDVRLAKQLAMRHLGVAAIENNFFSVERG